MHVGSMQATPSCKNLYSHAKKTIDEERRKGTLEGFTANPISLQTSTICVDIVLALTHASGACHKVVVAGSGADH